MDFDKVLHGALFDSMGYLHLPAKLIKMVKALYSNPRFQVCMYGHQSQFYPQRAGIRQGCPLSPYLF
eukprot:12919284-Prorocentrum_lima.AAC.1